ISRWLSGEVWHSLGLNKALEFFAHQNSASNALNKEQGSPMTSHESDKSSKIDNHQISRRSFLGTTAAGSAALLTGGLATLFEESALVRSSFPFVEATISQLQAAMANGQLTSHDLVLGYLN